MRITGIETFSLREPTPQHARDWWSSTPLDVLHDPATPRLQRRQPGAEDTTSGETTTATNVVVVLHAEDGSTGLGTVGVGSPVAVSVIEHHLARLVLGTNILDTERTWQTMYRNTLALGRKGVVLEAISAIDIALWDLIGKELGQPVYNLLGGLARPRVRGYASQAYARTDLGLLHEEVSGYAASGYTAVKMRFGYGPGDGRAGMRANRDLVRTVREAAGDDMDIATEAYMGWDAPYAIAMIRLVEDIGIAWVEEPVGPDSLERCAYIRSKVGVPISGGEHEFTLAGFRDVITAGAVDILQPDVNRMGGITAARKVFALAEAHDIPVIPHSNQAHNAHLVVSGFNSPMMEVFPDDGVRTGYNFYHEFFHGEPRARDGYVSVADTPGLGLSLVPDVMNDHLVQRRVFGQVAVDVLADRAATAPATSPDPAG